MATFISWTRKSTRGERHSGAKLTEDDVREIRGLTGKMPQYDVAALFGISRAQACRIQKGNNWGWLQ